MRFFRNATDIGGCFLGDAGDSCDDACSALGGTCDEDTTLEPNIDLFRSSNIEAAMTAMGVTCDEVQDESTSNSAPYYNTANGKCVPSAAAADRNFRCQASSSNYQRVCCCAGIPSAAPTLAPVPPPTPASRRRLASRPEKV